MKRSIICFMCAAVIGALPLSASAIEDDLADNQEDTFQLEQHSQNGVVYLSGGVGQDERDAMQSVRNEYTLWLTFAHADESSLSSDTEVTIHDAKGRLLLDATAEGPWMMIKLPAGTYRINARQDDAAATQRVTVKGKGVTRTVVRMHEKQSG